MQRLLVCLARHREPQSIDTIARYVWPSTWDSIDVPNNLHLTVTGLRRAQPAFRRRRFFEGKPSRTGDQVRDIAWLTTAGTEMTPEDWNSGFKCVSVFLNGEAIPSPNLRGERVLDDSFLLCFNAHSKPVDLVTPDITYGQEWTAEFDTAASTGATSVVVKAGGTVSLEPRSVVVLRKTA